MNKTEHLDEFQLLKRGNVFKHGLFSLGGLLLVNALLYSCGIEWASGKWAELTIILFTVALCCIEFIYYGIYPLTEKRQKFLYYFAGLFGTVAIVSGIYELVSEKARIIVDGHIADSVLMIAYGIMFAAILVAYIIKTKHDARHEKDE